MLKASLPRSLLLACGLGLAPTVAAQYTPIYSPPAPLDAAGTSRVSDAKFINLPVVGIRPSKDFIVIKSLLGLMRRNISPRSLLFAGYEVARANYNL